MNREIKFRAWDKENKKMDAVLIFMVAENKTYPHSRGYIHNCQDWEEHGLLTNPVIMQYTGLKDKNGKEIYEGDIVSVKSIIYDTIEPFEKSTKIEFQIFCEVIWCNKIAGYDLKKIDGDNKPDAWGFYNENVNPFEVIGNIYENPELINSK